MDVLEGAPMRLYFITGLLWALCAFVGAMVGLYMVGDSQLPHLAAALGGGAAAWVWFIREDWIEAAEIHPAYGTVINPGDVTRLIDWWKAHR